MQRFDAIVIGQGYAGLLVAKQAVERGLRVASIEAMMAGGLVMSVNELDPVPDGGSPCGAELTGNLAMANMENGIENISDAVTSLTRESGGYWSVKTHADTYTASNVIVASGARLRQLGIPGEEEFAGRGVSECADCDGPFYQGKEVVVVGGGDSAFQEALVLTTYCSKVTIIMRGTLPRARGQLVEAAAQNPKIILRPNIQVNAILGDPEKVMTGVRIQTTDADDAILPCSGFFAFVGLKPNSDFLPPEVNRDASGAVVTRENLMTNLPGLWAIGAVRSGFGGLLSDAATDAASVAAAI